VAGVTSTVDVAELVSRLEEEFDEARRRVVAFAVESPPTSTGC